MKTNRIKVVQKLTDRHREILRRLLTGADQTTVAEDVHVARETISRLLRSPCAQEYLARLREERDRLIVRRGSEPDGEKVQNAQSILIDNAETAAQYLADAARGLVEPGPGCYLRLQACAQLLDRAGVAKISRQELHIEKRHEVNPEYAEHLRKLALEAARKSGLMIDVKPAETYPTKQ